MRVMVLSSTYPSAPDDPSPRFVHTLCSRLARTHEVRVVCPHVPGAQRFETLEGVRVVRFRYAPELCESLSGPGGIVSRLREKPVRWILVPLFFVALVITTFRQVRSFKPDVIHAHWIFPQGAALWVLALFCRLPPVIVTSHGTDLLGLNFPAARWLKRGVIRMTSLLAVVSTAMAARAEADYQVEPSKLVVAPMGVDFPSGVADRGRIPYRILFVGRLVEGKGIVHLVKCMPDIVARLPRATLWIVGEGPLGPYLKEQVHLAGLGDRVIFTGGVRNQDLGFYYQSASLFCAPFVAPEGLGLVTLEAIGHRCPILVGDVPAQHDIVPEEFRPQVMIDATDHKAFVDRVVSALVSPYGEEVRGHLESQARRRYSWETVTEEYERIFEEALAIRK